MKKCKFFSGKLKITKIPLKTEERGFVVQGLCLKNIKNAHIVSIKKNKIRGNHFHKKQTETIVIVKGKVQMKFAYNNKVVEMIKDKNTAFVIEIKPEVQHAFKNLSNEESILFCFSDKLLRKKCILLLLHQFDGKYLLRILSS